MSVPSDSAQGTPEPSSQVLSLVSAFLSTHGFESTSKALRKELKRKTQIIDLEIPSEGTDLQSIVESWNEKQAQSSSSDEPSLEESEGATSGSDSDSSSATSSEVGHTSTSSDAVSESEPEEAAPQIKPTKLKKSKTSKKDLSPATSSSSSSDSDADDENEDDMKVKPARKISPTTIKKTEAVRSLKRKAASSSPEASSSESESPDGGRPAKRIKGATDSEASSSEVSSSSEDPSESEESSTKSGKDSSSDADTSSSEEEQEDDEKSKPAQLKSLAKLMNAAAEAPSDSSSNTVMGDVVEPEEDSAEPEDSRAENNNGSTPALTKKRHVGARPTPLAQLSAHASADTHISNAYQSYDYADRAYNDLSVTRGKGFTKEKNKKKRGSYRGGAIDTSGGKSFKFDD